MCSRASLLYFTGMSLLEVRIVVVLFRRSEAGALFGQLCGCRVEAGAGAALVGLG